MIETAINPCLLTKAVQKMTPKRGKTIEEVQMEWFLQEKSQK
jgi:hypothetical protein